VTLRSSSTAMQLADAPAALGNLLAVCVLAIADAASTVPKVLAYAVVDLIDRLTGSGVNVCRKKIAWHAPRYTTAPVLAARADEYKELDVPATLAASTFPLAPEELIRKAKAVMAVEFGTKAGSNPDHYLTDDFQFVAPIVGPLSKTEFVNAFGSFKVKEAFPDLQDNAFFTVDPLEPNRVWFFSRATGTHTGPLNFGAPIAPTGKRVESPPQ